MIELNSITQQDFLNREWVQKLKSIGYDMSDAKYIIAKDKLSKYDDEPDLTDYIWYKDSSAEVYDVCPTYSVSEMYTLLSNRLSVFTLHDNMVQEGVDNGKSLIDVLASLLIRCTTNFWI